MATAAYVIAEGNGKKYAAASMCVDITYAQAEILNISDDIKRENPDAFIVGFATSAPNVTVDKFLAGYKGRQSKLDNTLAWHKKVLSSGIEPFIIRHYPEDFVVFMKYTQDVQLGFSMDEVVTSISIARDSGEQGDVNDIVSFLDSIEANPLQAGVHIDFPATKTDHEWISDAVHSIRKNTPDRWLRRLLVSLRFYFHGKPKVPLPHKNDRCPCNSNRKYGKCCGAGVEHEDPEDCKRGKHAFTTWRRYEDKYIRSCEKCFRVYEAPWFEASRFEDLDFVIIGCRACSSKPTDEEIRAELEKANRWHTCAVCGKPLGLSFMLLEHMWSDGKHLGKWMATEMTNKGEAADITSQGLGKAAFIHRQCFEKALPEWPRVAKVINTDAKFSMEIPMKVPQPKE